MTRGQCSLLSTLAHTQSRHTARGTHERDSPTPQSSVHAPHPGLPISPPSPFLTPLTRGR
jgi:hypothetical protein